MPHLRDRELVKEAQESRVEFRDGRWREVSEARWSAEEKKKPLTEEVLER